MTHMAQLRTTLGRQILIFNGLIIVMTIVYYFLGGFDTEELSSLLTLLTAVSAIYLGSLFKYLGGSIAKAEALDAPEPAAGPGKLVLWIVPVHFMLLTGIISAKAFTQITFQEMNIFLGLVEAVFGSYLGVIISQVFNAKKVES